jgi:succinate dehydrogenase hydrophobic anchor subunit
MCVRLPDASTALAGLLVLVLSLLLLCVAQLHATLALQHVMLFHAPEAQHCKL